MSPTLAYIGAFVAIVVGTATSNFYLFIYGCTWWLSGTVLESRDETRRTRERLDDIIHAFDPLHASTGRSVGEAVNEAIARGWGRGGRA